MTNYLPADLSDLIKTLDKQPPSLDDITNRLNLMYVIFW